MAPKEVKWERGAILECAERYKKLVEGLCTNVDVVKALAVTVDAGANRK